MVSLETRIPLEYGTSTILMKQLMMNAAAGLESKVSKLARHRAKFVIPSRFQQISFLYTCTKNGFSQMSSKLEDCAHNDLICFFSNIITYLLLNSDYGAGCVLLSTWFGDICGIRTDLCTFFPL